MTFLCEEIPTPANDNSPECQQCGARFAFKPGKKFCSRACKKRFGGRAENRHKNGESFECAGCGVAFKRRTNSRNKGKYCSRECSDGGARRLASPENREIAKSFLVSYSVRRNKCQDCESWVTSPQGRLRCEPCDISHKRNRQDELRGVDRSKRTCLQCGVEFTPPYGRAHASYCSNACCYTRNYTLRRNLLTDPANDNVDPFVVFDRDDWRCQLCGVKTPRKLRGTYEPNAPELDHIIPVSKGGMHTYLNTQCACRRCNIKKGNKILGQMMLFG